MSFITNRLSIKRNWFLSLFRCFSWLKNCIYWYGQIWVLKSLYLLVIREMHDQIASGHPDWQKTMNILACNYYWPKIKNTIYRYSQNCHICRHIKTSRDQYNNILKSLLIFISPWTDFTLDFMTGLLPSNDYNAILIVIDRLTKKKN